MDDKERNDELNSSETPKETTGKVGKIKDTATKAKKLGKQVSKAIKSGAAKQSLIAALGPILLWAFVIIVIIIIIIGIAMFLVTMPGMVMDKLKAMSKAVGNYVAAMFGADTTEQIDEVEVYETLDYLEQMGWDLKGEGFLTDYMVESDVEDVKNNSDEEVNPELDTKTGVVRGDDDKILKADSDFIFKYMVSDNYVYTIKNNNLVTHNKEDGFFEKVFSIVTTGIYKIRNFFLGPIYDLLGVTEALYGRFGSGLIAIRYEGSFIGDEGNFVNTGTLWNWDSIKINTSSKTLSISKNSILSTIKGVVSGQKAFNNPMEFNLDGWTGRYGMPLEFLLAVHKATLMPDLAYDMVETFGTEINILLHDIEGSAIANYKTSNGYVSFKELNEAFTGLEGSNFFSAIISWFDNLQTNEKEAQLAFKMGIEHSPDCTCELGTITIYTYAGNLLTKDGDNYTSIKVGDNTYALTKSGNNYSYTIDGETTTFSADDVEPGTQDGEYTKICQECLDYITKLTQILQDNTNYQYEAYAPYISSVKDHWYRDVYFVINNAEKPLNFVDFDYDYEIMTGERWTLYQTYTDNPSDGDLYDPERVGEFVYYKLNEDGSMEDTPYKGNVIEGDVEVVKGDTTESLRIASMGENGEKVVKRAVTISSSDTDKLTDFGWNNNSGSVWTAYESNQQETSVFDPLFEDVEDDGSYESIIKKNCYINLKTTGNIIQTGEGQRTETNNDIKKMFLMNNYFRYDGTDTTAEIIAALRDSIYGDSKDRYGPISDDKLNESYTLDFSDAKYTSSAKNGSYKVKDYVGNVTLNQDSLNAFSMLENTHTLDADYIYRDFKELIVELGYFQKEELTDETPRLLQWLVPDIGSGGYPDKAIDRRENEFGTMVHSKSDIEANDAHKLTQLIAELKDEIPEDMVQEENQRINQQNASGLLNGGNIISNPEVGAISPSSNGGKKPSQISVDEFLQTTREMCEYMDEEGYDYCVYSRPTSCDVCNASGCVEECKKPSGCSCDKVHCRHTVQHNENCSLATTFTISQESPEKHNVCCATLVSWALQNVEVMPDSAHANGVSSLASWIKDNLDPELIEPGEQLKPGDILFYGDAHTDLLGEDLGGGSFVKYNGGHPAGNGKSSIETSSGWSGSRPPTYALRLNWGGSKPKSEPYVGYEGNEAVVSPVTGILLDYGTYEKAEDGNLIPTETPGEEPGAPVTKDDPRVNVDLKYGFPNIYENNATDESGNGGNGANGGSDSKFESKIVSDKVGYAKILVLDAENYQKLESGTSNTWQSNSLVKIDQKTVTLNETDQATSKRVIFKDVLDGKKENRDDKYSDVYKDWSTLDKTIYGYKEFAETYEKYGIAGYVVYIDGFKCELPDESLISEEGADNSGEEDIAAQIPSGDPLTIDSFKITDVESDDLIDSKYEREEDYKLASQKATDKLEAENTMKEEAVSSLAVNDLIFIKEGTIIGRTLTDKELLESPDFRNSEYGTYEELRGKTESGSGDSEDEENENRKLIGNYLRVMLQDKTGTMIENPEDYMKLDEVKKELSDWELFYWLPFESGGTDIDGSGPECQGTCSGGETAVGIIQWTVLARDYHDDDKDPGTPDNMDNGGKKDMNNIATQFIKGCLEENPGLCAPLAAYESWSAEEFWLDYKGSKQFQAVLSQICDVDRDGFLQCQMEVAKKQYLVPILEKYPWLESRPSCVQGEIMHLSVWGAKWDWVGGYESSSDEEIIAKVRNTIANTSSTAGEATGDESSGRAYNEPQIALEILSGAMNEDDVEQWVRTKDTKYLSFDWKGN